VTKNSSINSALNSHCSVSVWWWWPLHLNNYAAHHNRKQVMRRLSL